VDHKKQSMRASNDGVEHIATQKTSWHQPGHILYQFEELAKFPRARRPVIFQQAMEHADHEWPVITAGLIWVVVGFIVLMTAPELHNSLPLFSVVFIAGAPFLLIRRFYMKRFLRALPLTPSGSVVSMGVERN
jgi:hypothetical protein